MSAEIDAVVATALPVQASISHFLHSSSSRRIVTPISVDVQVRSLAVALQYALASTPFFSVTAAVIVAVAPAAPMNKAANCTPFTVRFRSTCKLNQC